MIFSFSTFRKKNNKKLIREQKERERWEGVLQGIEEKVNHEYGYHQYIPAHEPIQKWVPMDEDRKTDEVNEVTSIIEKRARTAASSMKNIFLFLIFYY